MIILFTALTGKTAEPRVKLYIFAVQLIRGRRVGVIPPHVTDECLDLFMNLSANDIIINKTDNNYNRYSIMTLCVI